MESSILNSIKKLLGIDASYTQFDTDIIIHINSAFAVLNQLGVGPEKCYTIEDDDDDWDDFLSDSTDLEEVKTYVYLKVKMFFDPPQSSILLGALEKNIAELEWRLNVAVDPKQEAPDGN